MALTKNTATHLSFSSLIFRQFNAAINLAVRCGYVAIVTPDMRLVSLDAYADANVRHYDWLCDSASVDVVTDTLVRKYTVGPDSTFTKLGRLLRADEVTAALRRRPTLAPSYAELASNVH